MGDWLEKYVQENRSYLDQEFQGEDRLWKSIDNGLERNGPRSMHFLWKVAAVLFMITTGWLLLDRANQQDNPKVLSMQAQEFLQAESFYSAMIIEKRNLIQDYDNETLVAEFEKDLRDLDSLYEQLKVDFEAKSGDEKIMNAMINNLRLRVEILNRQIEVLERINAYEEEINAASV